MVRSKEIPRIVIDTNVIISSLRSQYGSSYKLLTLLGSDKYELYLSVAIVLEYESVSKRIASEIDFSVSDIDAIIDYICSIGKLEKHISLLRPMLNDPNDDMILELAVQAHCAIITYNKNDFKAAAKLGVSVLTPKEFLQQIGVL